ncbi:MAG: SpoIVB peptidase, partial [Lachnospiraceae bacterium]|nr:SpoIVB peptidase [Lachnospiraceae bacterium]
ANRLNLEVSEEEVFDFPLPIGVTFESECEEVVLGNPSNIPAGQVKIQTADPVSMYGTAEGSYQIDMKLFGLIHMKDIQVDVVKDVYLVPCGTPIGIYLRANGVMVIGTGEIVSDAGNAVEPAFGILKSGDYIETINGQELDDKEDLIAAVNACGGEAVHMEVRRNGEVIDVEVNPVQAEDGSYKLGAWVRDDTQGIGTVTYVTRNGSFGALGHGISDSDTGQLVDAKEGELYETQILGIEKGAPGNPGVMSGVIYYGTGTKMGRVSANKEEGIFGTVNPRFQESIESAAIPVGFRQDVKKGNAVIRSSVSGEVRDYDVEIQKVDHASIQKNKGMTIKVVDEELLELTGGIVQGMSGSPIIQDGKIVGAVTHVLVNDPTRGYGIFIENMLEAAE